MHRYGTHAGPRDALRLEIFLDLAHIPVATELFSSGNEKGRGEREPSKTFLFDRAVYVWLIGGATGLSTSSDLHRKS